MTPDNEDPAAEDCWQDSSRVNTATPSVQDEPTDDGLPMLFGDDEEEENEAMIDADIDAALEEDSDFGGIVNIGNTCYLASSLQLLSGLEGFVARLANQELPSSADARLRSELLAIVRRLAAGESASPDDFKAIIDERSTLFIGSEQQDAHEFVSTLLDLLDEDYKKKENDESTDEEEEQVSTLESPTNKRARTDANCSMDSASSWHPPSPFSMPVCRSSFSELNIDEIGRLLHDDTKERFACESPIAVQPRYKLVGGRMNTADVVMTPYDSKLPAESRASSSTPPSPTAKSSGMTAQPNDEQSPSPVDEYFKTTVRVRLTCDSCKYTRTHKESFLHLSLEIGSSATTVEDGLRRFFSPEKRELKCEKCFSESATQTMEILSLPKALLLHFKRFIVDIGSFGVSYSKNQSAVTFDSTLEFDEDDGGVLNEFLASDRLPPPTTSISPVYALRSVVNHAGFSASFGHYTADALRRTDDGREWIRFNDCYVSRISAREAIEESQRTAYLVLYELE